MEKTNGTTINSLKLLIILQSQEISNFTGAVMNPSQSDLMKNGPRTTEPLYFLVIHYIAQVYSMILAGVSVELVNP